MSNGHDDKKKPSRSTVRPYLKKDAPLPARRGGRKMGKKAKKGAKKR